MSKNKEDSFSRLIIHSQITEVIAAQHYDDFMKSEFDDAYDYFNSLGLISTVQKQPTDIEICKVFIDIILNHVDSTIEDQMLKGGNDNEQDIEYLKKTHMKNVLRYFKGTVEPRRVYGIIEELLKKG